MQLACAPPLPRVPALRGRLACWVSGMAAVEAALTASLFVEVAGLPVVEASSLLWWMQQ